MAIIFRHALPTDALSLTELMHASSAYRGRYAAILEGYTVSPSQIERDIVCVAEQDGSIVGFFSVVLLSAEPELDLMFVADHMQRSGLGTALFHYMTGELKRQGMTTVRITAHPPAVGFYQKMGAIIVGKKAVAGKIDWERPILILALQESGEPVPKI